VVGLVCIRKHVRNQKGVDIISRGNQTVHVKVVNSKIKKQPITVKVSVLTVHNLLNHSRNYDYDISQEMLQIMDIMIPTINRFKMLF
jgi:hypothetical protein